MRLRSRAPEFEQALFDHVRTAVPDSSVDGDIQHRAGLHEMIGACVDLWLESFEQVRPCSPAPPAVTAQVRRAASIGIGLSTALRRCVASHAFAWSFVLEEMRRASLPAEQRHELLVQASVTVHSMLDLLQCEIATAHVGEIERRARSSRHRRAEIVHKLLAGGTPDDWELAQLDYELDAWHIGVIATGADAERTVQRLEAGLGCTLLALPCGGGAVWAWLGAQRRLSPAQVECRVPSREAADVSLSVGEARRGLDGWRLTHGEAQGAARVACCRPGSRLTRYADVAPEAAALQDKSLADALVARYLSPLDDMAIGGQAAHGALRALFDVDNNVSSAAHVLGVHRSTVNRWRSEIEERLGCGLRERQGEIQLALRVADLRGAGEQRATSLASNEGGDPR